MAVSNFPARQGLYDPKNEKDSCGMGFVASIKGEKTHKLVEDALVMLDNLTHRGATGFDPLLGDGAGILVQIPDRFFRKAVGTILPPVGQYGVGMLFMPSENNKRDHFKTIIENGISALGLKVICWRDVPTDNRGISKSALAACPIICQVFVRWPGQQIENGELERKLFIARKSIESLVVKTGNLDASNCYIPSFSSRTVVYKGMVLARQVGEFYEDLKDLDFKSSLALVHQRFSTNTFPSWALSQPFRLTAHNGEINTVGGNINWMRAREGVKDSRFTAKEFEKLLPFISHDQSDTASFDNALELLLMGGYSLAHATMLLIPEAWEGSRLMKAERKAFYRHHAPLMEPWDGPAAIVFTDGVQIGATLDRNGLRPSRFVITKDDVVVMASESGVLPLDQEKIEKKWRLEPGKMLLIDTQAKKIITDDDLKDSMARKHDYKSLVQENFISLQSISQHPVERNAGDLHFAHKIFGFSQEDLKFVLRPMMETGQESIGSMGNDSPPAVLSDRNKALYNYFKQLFAQVTNPPIDPIREELVMSLITYLGPKPNLFNMQASLNHKTLESNHPLLDNKDMACLESIGRLTGNKFQSSTLSITASSVDLEHDAEGVIKNICEKAKTIVESGISIIILSDIDTGSGRIPLPALLATSAVHHFLVEQGLRTRVGLIIQTGSAREVHHFALLAGFGAEAVHPWLAIDTVSYLSQVDKKDPALAVDNYRKAIGKGLFKVMSKMGISTYRSYCGAQVFEAVGLKEGFVNKYFKGTSSKIGGVGLPEVIDEALRTHKDATDGWSDQRKLLDAGGEYASRTRGEKHLWTSDSISKLQRAVRSKDQTSYDAYAELINEQTTRHMTFRGLFDIKGVGPKVKLCEVESWTEIVKRFSTGAMSMGSISTEAHSTLAIAMNRLKGKSNTGEGGEDAIRFRPINTNTNTAQVLGNVVVKGVTLQKGDSLRSRIKQVASGRFGVTSEYLLSADQIQIKIAQGAKPGEGGQLPGHKVSEYIAKLRFSVPGVGLISPPPHHDIYSIEDLAQLIHDLKNVNPDAMISVKLVSEVGVGTIAAGVAKCKADHITIAGYDGGTGASPLSSIKHAGTPWELGLAETQQTLVLNRLRGRVSLQVDGQMKTGRDVIIGALLGADEFGFATAPLVAEGCIMMRKCHLNTCPVGVATQDEELRKKFSGKPEYVINYFYFVANEIRQIMSEIGVKTLNELIGRSDLLDMKKGIDHWKAKGLDFSKVFHRPKMPEGTPRYHQEKQDHRLNESLDVEIISKVGDSITTREPVRADFEISNVNRSVGSMLSGRVASMHGHAGLADDTISVNFTGTAGQSFGAFLSKGLSFYLEGDANDYTGKGLCGGKIVIRPPRGFTGKENENIIVGNTVLYGAVAGEVYFCGVAGERFAVRNSGVNAVVEGVGDHGCEYMTGGTVVVLGKTGANFAAGMSGGIAYIFDEAGNFTNFCNQEMVTIEKIAADDTLSSKDLWHLNTSDETLLRRLIQTHYNYTNSKQAKLIINNWDEYLGRFIKVFPKEYKRALIEMSKKERSELEAA